MIPLCLCGEHSEWITDNFHHMTAQQDTTLISQNLLDLTPERAGEVLGDWVAGRGLPSYRVGQMLRRLWQAPIDSWQQATDLPAALRPELDHAFPLARLTPETIQQSTDGTRKYLWRLSDGEAIESVLIPSGSRRTLCISDRKSVV